MLAELGSGAIANFGSAVANLGFAIAGPAPIIGIRQAVAAVLFLAVARPPIHRMPWSKIWPALVLAGSLVVMNLSFAFAIDRLPLGFAVTIQFLGPLAVVLLSTRRWIDIVIGLVAFGGVALLTGDVASIDWIGIGLIAIAAAGWAAYIVLSQFVGRRHVGLQGSAISVAAAAVCTLPISIVAMTRLPASAAFELLGWGALCGLLSTVIPQAIDMTVLRRMPRVLFSVLQSTNPAFAAIAGLVLLHQTLSCRSSRASSSSARATRSRSSSARVDRRPDAERARTAGIPVIYPPTGSIPIVSDDLASERGPEGVDPGQRVLDAPGVVDDIGRDTKPIPL